MVAERSVNLRKLHGNMYSGDIRSENVDMSSDKQRAKRCRLKSKVSKGRLIRLG